MKAYLAAAILALCASAVMAQDLPLKKNSPRPLPEVSFTDGAGRPLTLRAWRGKYVLLNLWATWCGPCRTEMPALDRLQDKLGGDRFEVVALSIDRGGVAAVRSFFDEFNIGRLRTFNDPSGRAAQNLNIRALPGTILVDPMGRELGRYIGPVEWDAKEIITFLRRMIGPQHDWNNYYGNQETSG